GRPEASAATPPEQPASGPGGREYAHLRVIGTRHASDAAAYWLFEPAAPSAPSAPVVVFLDGWEGTDPLFWGAWAVHLTLMLIAVGQDDQSAGDREGRYIFFQIPTRSKNFVTGMSEYHGTPPLVANHGAPVAPRKGFARAVAQDKVSSGAIMDLIRLKREQGD